MDTSAKGVGEGFEVAELSPPPLSISAVKLWKRSTGNFEKKGAGEHYSLRIGQNFS
jgi:hypothetical protein